MHLFQSVEKWSDAGRKKNPGPKRIEHTRGSGFFAATTQMAVYRQTGYQTERVWTPFLAMYSLICGMVYSP